VEAVVLVVMVQVIHLLREELAVVVLAVTA
jgi:hypothetical protein